jgi:hypothetical protein
MEESIGKINLTKNDFCSFNGFDKFRGGRASTLRRIRVNPMAGSSKMYGKHRFPGRLFIVEGIDGSGKSTQLLLLKKWLESEGYVVYFSE